MCCSELFTKIAWIEVTLYELNGIDEKWENGDKTKILFKVTLLYAGYRTHRSSINSGWELLTYSKLNFTNAFLMEVRYLLTALSTYYYIIYFAHDDVKRGFEYKKYIIYLHDTFIILQKVKDR